MLTNQSNHHWGLLAYTWEQFHRKCSRYISAWAGGLALFSGNRPLARPILTMSYDITRDHGVYRVGINSLWPDDTIWLWWHRSVQGWGQLHNINSNSNSNSRGFNSNSNSGQSPEYQLQLQLQLQRFQLQLQFQLRQISRISTPTPTPTPEVSTPTPIPTPEISTPIPTPTLELKIQPQLHFKFNQSCSTKLPLPNYNVKHCMN